MRIKNIYILLCFFTGIPLNGQLDYTFDQISTEDGLSQSAVQEIYEDSRGLIWIGTQDGLNSYNAYEFNVYKHDAYDSLSLDNSLITAIVEDYKGNLFIGTFTGLNYFDYAQQKMHRIGQNSKIMTSYDGFRVNNLIRMEEDSTIWICSNNGLYIYYEKTNTFEKYSTSLGDGSIGSDVIHDVLKTSSGKYYIAVDFGNLILFNREQKTFKEINYDPEFLATSNFFKKRLREDKDGNIVITAQGSGLVIYNPTAQTSKIYTVNNSGLPHQNTDGGVIFKDDNEWWIGSDGGGIITFNPETETFGNITQDLSVEGSLSTNSVYTLFKDSNGIIWVGTFGAGINVYDKNKYKFRGFKHKPDNPASIAPNPVLAVYQDKKGRVWVGNDGGGLNLFDVEKGTFKRFRHDPDDPTSIRSDVIVSIGEDKFGNILLGTYGAGMMSFNPETEELIKHFMPSDDPGSILRPHVWSIYLDSKGQNYIGLLGAGIQKYDGETEMFSIIGSSEWSNGVHNINDFNCMYINKDINGNIWAASEVRGIYVIDEENENISQILREDDKSNTLGSNNVKCFKFTNEHVYIGTSGGGLDIYNRSEESFKNFGQRDGLPSNSVMGFLLDASGDLWISTTDGICHLKIKESLSTDEWVFKNYFNSDGLPGNEFKYDAQEKLKNGKMLFGGIDGLAVFHPDSVGLNPNIPNIIFTDFKLFNKSVEINSENSPLDKHINEVDQLVLQHYQNVMTIEFAALNFTASDRNQYKYMLDGFDENWIESGTQRFAMYTNLDPGSYTFLVNGSNNDGVWNDSPRELKIRVLPPWWKTWWFYTLLAIIVILIIYVYIRIRERQLEADKLVLEKKIEAADMETQKQRDEIDKTKQELKEKEIQERDLKYYNRGLAMFADIISKNRDNLEELARNLAVNLVEYVEAEQSAIYILNSNDEEEEQYLELKGSFGVDKSKILNKKVQIGEGLIGSCFKDAELLKVDDLPDSYVISSGLGEKKPNYLLLLPLKLDDINLGVLELTSLNELKGVKIEFLEKLAESIASTISINISNNKIQDILEQTNQQQEQLKSQDEELRQNIEEMEATQEESSRKKKELEELIKRQDEELKVKEKEIVDLKQKLSAK